MFLAVWWRRLVLFARRDRARRELEDEMQLHRDLRTRAMQSGAMTAADAAATARRRFGHQPTLAERSQESWGFQRSDEVRWNLRYAMRRLANRPGYAATIVLVLGLGIGATTAMFSAVDAVMLRALPFREPGRLVSLVGVELPFARGRGKPAEVRAMLDLDDVAAAPELFSSVAAFAAGRLNLPDPARLAPGMEIEAANSRLLERWAQKIDGHDPRGPREEREQWLGDLRGGGAVQPLQASLSGARARALLVLLGATGLLLLIACANVTNLLLSDAATRTREMALRTALGASRGRVFRQVLTESVILALGGIVAGLLLAPVVLGALQALMPAELAGVAVLRIDWRVLGFASSLGLVTGIGFGLWPARAASRTDPGETLKSSGNPLATGRRSARGSRMLIAVEVALSLMLLVGSALLLRSFAKLMGVERGMETANVASLDLSFGSSTPNAIRLAHIEAMLERLRRSPGVESAAAISDLPLGSDAFYTRLLDPVDARVAPPMMSHGARYVMVSPGYFGTLGIPLVRGRNFTPRDDSLAPPTVIINEALARRWFPDADPVGRQLTESDAPGLKLTYSVVGVVADTREAGLADDVDPQLYHPVYRVTPIAFALVVRGRADPAALLAALRNAVRAVDPTQAVGRARMMDQVVRDSVAPRRANALLISLFAGLAVVLAALGVYSVVVHGMARRGREFGIRTALGATAGDLLVMVSREIFVVVAIGIAIGLAGAWAGARVVEAMVYGVTVHDLASFTIAPTVLCLIAMTAAVVPLRRVFRVNPADVIRRE